ncbi:MAG TPA: FUSC family protein, partial [Segetibacter sp.]
MPAFLLAYFDMLSVGIVIALGALFVSVTDSPGPIHHRRNGMFVCVCSILIGSLLTGFAAHNTISLAIFLGIACFFYSMINIYGARAGSIGTASMIVITLTIDPHLNLATTTKIIEHSLLITLGGLWYMCYSLLLYNVRPYRLPQQALGDCIQATAEYLQLRADLYKRDTNYDTLFRQLLQKQADVQHKQIELNELLFKTRSIVKESTNVGRTLVMIHLDVVDIFERIMMSHQKYEALHNYFDETDILDHYHLLAKELAAELDEVGLAVKSGTASATSNRLQEHIDKTVERLDNLRETYLKPDNIEGFISLRRILQNIQDLADRLKTLHKYTRYDKLFKKNDFNDERFQSLISSQPITPRMLLDNLTLKSDSCRHSLRVSIAVVTGFITARFFDIGHSYWILLTIIVILKPAFSLTKKRNGDRLAGTFAGILIGLAILFVVKSSIVLLILLIILMAV